MPSRSVSTYYVLVATQALSMIGSRTSSLAVGIAVFRATGHATPLALIAVFFALPWVLFGGLGGALADRFDRRTLMLAANVGYALASGLLLLAFASGAFSLWQLYALTIANGVFNLVETPALQASVAMLVPDAHRDRANAIQQLAYPASVVLAGAFAGVLYVAAGVTGAILVDLATFAVAIAVLAVVRIPTPAPGPGDVQGAGALLALWRQSFDGFRHLAAQGPLLALCVYIAVVSALAGGLFWALMTPYVLDRVHMTAVFGLVVAAGFSGAVAGALAMAAWGGARPRIHTVMIGILLAGAGMALFGMLRTPVPMAVALFLLTFAIPFANAATFSIFQAKVAPDRQGRVFAALGQLISVLNPLASLAGGPLADRVAEPAVAAPGWRAVAWLVGDAPGAGIGLIYVAAGLAIVAVTLAFYAAPVFRRMEATLPDQAAVAA
ncbi:MAG TPA: MFS transporter [Caulobacteraceae bacterium]|nr:MFS transporter [Caulobacteraceae bacterium]